MAAKKAGTGTHRTASPKKVTKVTTKRAPAKAPKEPAQPEHAASTEHGSAVERPGLVPETPR